MQVIIPNAVPQGAFTRASVANYWNSSGVLTSAANDVLRIGYDPLNLNSPPAAMVEAAATNILLNSATLSTQSVTTTATNYVLSFYGTGTIVLSGTATGTVVGVGASPNRKTYFFTPTAGTLTLSVSGAVSNAQLETGSAATSYITTTGTAVTRAADTISTQGLIYSNIAEPDTTWPAWNSGTAYVVNDKVSYLHRQYTCVVNNTNRNPLTDTTLPPAWVDYGPTNRYAMFDSVVGTSTSNTSGSIIVVMNSGLVNGLAFMQMVADTIKVDIGDGITSSYKNTIDMSSSLITDWWQYFNSPITRRANYVITDAPGLFTGIVTLVITTNTGTCSAGNVVSGPIYAFTNTSGGNSTASAPTVGIIDYSVKAIDAFGNASWTKRGYANRMNVKMMLDSVAVDAAVSQLAAIRATPCVWIGAGNTYQSLIVYGCYKDWEIEISYPTKSYCTATIEGLI